MRYCNAEFYCKYKKNPEKGKDQKCNYDAYCSYQKK